MICNIINLGLGIVSDKIRMIKRQQPLGGPQSVASSKSGSLQTNPPKENLLSIAFLTTKKTKALLLPISAFLSNKIKMEAIISAYKNRG